MNNKDCTIGFLMGMGAGVALGVLYAPKSGQATRDKLSNQMKDTADEVKQQASNVYNSAVDAVDNCRTDMAKTKDSIKTGIDAGTRAYQEAASAN